MGERWTCQGCGCQFPKIEHDDDVKFCTQCVTVEQQALRIATLEAERDEARRERDAAVAQRERYRAILCNLVMDLDDLGRNGWHGIRKLTEAMARSATADEGGAAIEDVETCESCGRAIELVLKREELEQERWKEGPRP